MLNSKVKEKMTSLFVELMRFYWKFYSSKEYLHIEIKKPAQFETFHPVLQGRYYAYLLLKSESRDSMIEKKIIFDCKKSLKKKAYMRFHFY